MNESSNKDVPEDRIEWKTSPALVKLRKSLQESQERVDDRKESSSSRSSYETENTVVNRADVSPLPEVQTFSSDHPVSLPEVKNDQKVSGLVGGDLPLRYEPLRKRKDSSSMEDFRTSCKKNLFDLMGSMDFQEEGCGISGELDPEEVSTSKEAMETSLARSILADEQAQNDISANEFFDDEDEEEARQLELVLSQLDMSPYIISQSGGSDTSTTYESRKGGHLKCSRMLVLSVSEGFYQIDDESHSKCREKILECVMDTLEEARQVRLRGQWIEIPIAVGDLIHILGESIEQDPTCFLVDDRQNYLVYLPDCLVSGTVVADSFQCLRRAILNEKYKNPQDIASETVYGSLWHEAFGQTLRDRNFDDMSLRNRFSKLAAEHLDDFYAIRESEEMAQQKLVSVIPQLQAWHHKFHNGETFSEIVTDGRNVTSDPSTEKANKMFVRLADVLDIEENIWSPTLGLKGKIDVSTRMEQRRSPPGASYGDYSISSILAPLELKTGKPTKSTAHRAQVSLYTLMMSDRYGQLVEDGLLYYMKTNDMFAIPAVADEWRGLMSQRNLIAHYLKATPHVLPPVLKDKRICSECRQLSTCMTLHKTVESGDSDSSGLNDLFHSITAHIQQSHSDYLVKWLNWLALEETQMGVHRKEIWSMTSEERESLGRCLSNMLLKERCPSVTHEIIYSFEKRPTVTSTSVETSNSSRKSLFEFQFDVGDPVVISTEQGHLALAIGFVREITHCQLVITLDRELRGPPARKGPLDSDFIAMDDPLTCPETQTERGILYRIDKDEITSSIGLIRWILIRFLTAPTCHRLRDLVISLSPPRYEPATKITAILDAIRNSGQSLNIDQEEALCKILTAKDYALILGMPGTGKTSTIACMVWALVQSGKSVLVASYTHNAVDHVLIKLIAMGLNFVRLGDVDRVHPSLLPYTAKVGTKSLKTVDQLASFYEKAPVVATTCLGLKHPLFSRRHFDYCIIDEASQILQPICLGPLQFADTFVLVGDHNQLPPLVRNSSARESGMDESLFKYLCDAHPEAVVALRHQYRMNSDIMSLSNSIVYKGHLRCGSLAVATATLDDIDLSRWQNISDQEIARCHHPCWLYRVINPSQPVVFLNTDPMNYLEMRSGDAVQNNHEANLVYEVVEALIHCGVKAEHIGIISPYKAQLKMIRHLLRNYGTSLEIHTVDRFQGRDKQCILLSLVRSNTQGHVGELLKDWRRGNVAVTRSKKKLIIIGSKGTLQHAPFFNACIQHCEDHRWISF